jgi:D-psicose/D-tagatose/L-ribulose 3-epimerase
MVIRGIKKMTNPIGIISMQFQRPFTEREFPQFKRWKEAGYDFVELLVPEPGELDLAVTRRALEDNGLGVVLAARVNLDRNLTSDEASKRQAGRDYMQYCVEAATGLGAKIVGGPLFGNPLVFAGRAPHPVDQALRQQREDWCVEGLKFAGAATKGTEVLFGIEPLNRFETDILNTTRQGIALAKLVNHPSVGLVLDTFHMNMEDDDIPGAIREAGQHMIHFQANENHRGFLGTGHIEWTSVIRALSDINYKGTISLEPFRRTDERIGIPFAQWKAPSKDEQAQLRDSCAFIKNLIALNGGRV